MSEDTIKNEDWTAKAIVLINAKRNLEPILNACDDMIHTRSRIIYYRNPDLFSGMTCIDAVHDLRQIFGLKIDKLGFADCTSDQTIADRLKSMLHYSAKELLSQRLKTKRREVPVGPILDTLASRERHDYDNDEDEVNSSALYREQMLHVFLRECIAELRLPKQISLISAVLRGQDIDSIVKEWGATRQGVHQLFERAKRTLRHCIESKEALL